MEWIKWQKGNGLKKRKSRALGTRADKPMVDWNVRDFGFHGACTGFERPVPPPLPPSHSSSVFDMFSFRNDEHEISIFKFFFFPPLVLTESWLQLTLTGLFHVRFPPLFPPKKNAHFLFVSGKSCSVVFNCTVEMSMPRRKWLSLSVQYWP